MGIGCTNLFLKRNKKLFEIVNTIIYYGIGMRLHMLRWLSLSADVRDIILAEKFQSCDASSAGVCGTAVLHQVFTGIRLGIWIPPTFTYRFPR